jgi:hypothetical protein
MEALQQAAAAAAAVASMSTSATAIAASSENVAERGGPNGNVALDAALLKAELEESDRDLQQALHHVEVLQRQLHSEMQFPVEQLGQQLGQQQQQQQQHFPPHQHLSQPSPLQQHPPQPNPPHSQNQQSLPEDLPHNMQQATVQQQQQQQQGLSDEDNGSLQGEATAGGE